MDDGQKKKYMDLAAVDKKRYDKEKAQHIKKTQKEKKTVGKKRAKSADKTKPKTTKRKKKDVVIEEKEVPLEGAPVSDGEEIPAPPEDRDKKEA